MAPPHRAGNPGGGSVRALMADSGTKFGAFRSLRRASKGGMDWLHRHASTHNLVRNSIRHSFGKRWTIDGRFLLIEAKAASALATARLRWELSRAFPGSGG